MSRETKIFVAGHRGMVGGAILRNLKLRGYANIVTRTRKELDLLEQGSVRDFFQQEKPEQVYLAAAKVGGIYANSSYPAEFIYENLMVEANVIHEAWRNGVKKLLFLGSSCIYPRMAAQPMAENSLLTGVLEPTNEPYAIAKIAGVKICKSYNRQYGTDFRSVMPTNLYGPGDNYHPENSHVIPGLLRRFHEAEQKGAAEVVIWETGAPLREFLYVDDMAEACIHVMELTRSAYAEKTEPMLSHINIGTGEDVTIRDLAKTVGEVVGYKGRVVFDPSKPDGTPRKLMDVSRMLSFGWRPRTSLRAGLGLAYQDFLNTERR